MSAKLLDMQGQIVANYCAETNELCVNEKFDQEKYGVAWSEHHDQYGFKVYRHSDNVNGIGVFIRDKGHLGHLGCSCINWRLFPFWLLPVACFNEFKFD
jgi:hypothetical protein